MKSGLKESLKRNKVGDAGLRATVVAKTRNHMFGFVASLDGTIRSFECEAGAERWRLPGPSRAGIAARRSERVFHTATALTGCFGAVMALWEDGSVSCAHAVKGEYLWVIGGSTAPKSLVTGPQRVAPCNVRFMNRAPDCDAGNVWTIWDDGTARLLDSQASDRAIVATGIPEDAKLCARDDQIFIAADSRLAAYKHGVPRGQPGSILWSLDAGSTRRIFARAQNDSEPCYCAVT